MIQLKAGDWVTVGNLDFFSADKKYQVMESNYGNLYLIDDGEHEWWEPLRFIERYKVSKAAPPNSTEAKYRKALEADRRGAKFGVNGIIKATGEKIVFQKEFNKQWFVFDENEETNLIYSPEEIRLDHEPEYKEIPFSEATHEQRMNIENLVHSDAKVIEILQFKNGTYAYQLNTSGAYVWNNSSYLKVRVPV